MGAVGPDEADGTLIPGVLVGVHTATREPNERSGIDPDDWLFTDMSGRALSSAADMVGQTRCYATDLPGGRKAREMLEGDEKL